MAHEPVHRGAAPGLGVVERLLKDRIQHTGKGPRVRRRLQQHFPAIERDGPGDQRLVVAAHVQLVGIGCARRVVGLLVVGYQLIQGVQTELGHRVHRQRLLHAAKGASLWLTAVRAALQELGVAHIGGAPAFGPIHRPIVRVPDEIILPGIHKGPLLRRPFLRDAGNVSLERCMGAILGMPEPRCRLQAEHRFPDLPTHG